MEKTLKIVQQAACLIDTTEYAGMPVGMGTWDWSTKNVGSHFNPIPTGGPDYALPILMSLPRFDSQRHTWYVPM